MTLNNPRNLIINGDDFGYCEQVNRAIIQAHEQGILTSTSLMVTGEAFDQAVALAKNHPQLGVGMHLVLVCGKSVLSPTSIPHLVNHQGYFSHNPVLAGLNYQFLPFARQELEAEIRAQLDKFCQTGLTLSHLDGHLHLHMHPVILEIIAKLASEYHLQFIRLPAEELNLTPDANPLIWLIFSLLRRHGQKILDAHNLSYTERVYGLLATGKISEDYLLALIPQITANLVEIYSHPGASDSGESEKHALISQKVKLQLENCSFNLTNYWQIQTSRELTGHK